MYIRNLSQLLESHPSKKVKLSSDEPNNAVTGIEEKDDTLGDTEVRQKEPVRINFKKKSPCLKCPKPKDCQQCIYCKDMVKYGGPGIKKRPCKNKTKCWGECVNINQTGESDSASSSNNNEINIKSETTEDYDLPETNTEEVELEKDNLGIGINIIGYISAKEDFSGIFVKSFVEGSAADRSGKVKVNDKVLEIDGEPVHGFDHGVEMLRSTGKDVKLKLLRYVHGPLFEQLQQAIVSSNSTTPVSQSCPVKPTLVPTQIVKKKSIHPNTDTVTDKATAVDHIVDLVKDNNGLGVTIMSYRCEREELSGIYVKNVTEGSVAHKSGLIKVNDHIIEVDGESLLGVSYERGVKMFSLTGKVVILKLRRYSNSLKFEQLQQTIAHSNSTPPVSQPSEKSSPVKSPTFPPIGPVTNCQITTDNTSEEDTSNDNTEVRSAVSDMETDPGHGKIERDSSISR